MLVQKWREVLLAFFCMVLLAGCSQQSSAPASSPSPTVKAPVPTVKALEIISNQNADHPVGVDTNAIGFNPASSSLPTGKALVTLSNQNADHPVGVDTNAVGLSFELSQVCEMMSLDQANPTSYEQLFENLGSGIIHIGGHNADFGVWDPKGDMSCSATSTVVTQEMINTFFAFVTRVHWQVIWGLNLIGNDPQSMANEASYVASVAGPHLLAFDIGNEPDIYAKHGFRSSDWGYSDYVSEWNAYYAAIKTLVPAAKFIGSDACCETPFFYQFANDESGKIISLAHHYYVTTALYGSDLAEDIPSLLSQQVFIKQTGFIKQWVEAARQVGLPFEITESNTFSGGGKSGVSNTYASALWAVDYLCQATFLGVKRVDFQNASRASYDVFDENGNPTPLYSGLLFFHQLTRNPGSTIVSVGLQTTLNMTAYKIVEPNGVTHVVIINKDLSYNASVEIQLNASSTNARSLGLTGPRIKTTSNLSLGGRPLSAQGTWSSPSNLETVPVEGNRVSVNVPSGSAVEVTF